MCLLLFLSADENQRKDQGCQTDLSAAVTDRTQDGQSLSRIKRKSVTKGIVILTVISGHAVNKSLALQL